MPLPNMPLLDAVKQGSQSLVSPAGPNASALGLQPSAGETGAQVQQLTATAQTGKDLSTSSGGQARLSSIGEKLASLNTSMSAAALSAQGTAQSAAQMQQSAATDQQFKQQAAQLNQKTLDMRADFTNKLDGMMQQSAEQLQSLTLQDQRSKAEQMGTMMRLASDQYVTKLNDAATRARLNNEASFKATLASTVFDQETALFGSNLQFRNMLQQEHRQAIASVANMDLDFAMSMATAENKSAAGTQMWSGIGSVAGTAGEAYANSAKTPAPQQAAPAQGAPASSDTLTAPQGNVDQSDAVLGGGGTASA
jgi:hypothetical protein